MILRDAAISLGDDDVVVAVAILAAERGAGVRRLELLDGIEPPLHPPVVIPNCIDLSTLPNPGRRNRLILFVGRVVPARCSFSGSVKKPKVLPKPPIGDVRAVYWPMRRAFGATPTNSLAISATSAGVLNLGGNTLSMASGGLLMTGASNYTIQNGQIGASGAFPTPAVREKAT